MEYSENQPKKFNFAKSFKTHDSMKKFINMCIKHYNLKNTKSLKDTNAVSRLDEWRNIILLIVIQIFMNLVFRPIIRFGCMIVK